MTTLGTILGGKYALLRRIGEGGMAEVFLARQTGIEGFSKLLVIKRILPAYSQDPSFCRRFMDEARIAALINHPNVVQVFDVGHDEGQYFIAMEYLKGEDVSAMLDHLKSKNERLPLQHALTIVSDACAGLEFAHHLELNGEPLGIVHRDVAPRNIMVTYTGVAKVVDFGIAKAATKVTNTTAGVLRGSTRYMSPEQVLGQELDARSDVFSLGAVTYEMTTGSEAFGGENEYRALEQIVNGGLASPRELVPDYPVALEKIVLRAMERNRNARYPSCRELQLDLDTFAQSAGLRLGALGLAPFMNYAFKDRKDRQDWIEKHPDQPTPLPIARMRTSSRKPLIAASSDALWIAGAVATIVALTAASLWRLYGREPVPPPPPPVAQVTQPPPPPAAALVAPPADVALDVATSPAGAEVFLAGKSIGHSPLQLRLPRGEAPVQLTVRRPGFRDGVQDIVPSQDLVVNIVMSETPKPIVERRRPDVRKVAPAADAVDPPAAHDDLVNP